MPTANPYGEDLGNRDPLTALSETPEQIRRLLTGWSDDQFERTYAPGKWTVRKILIHLAQTELALSQSGYQAQAFSQDDWLPLDEACDARTALDAYTTLRKFNLAMWRKLAPAQRQRTFSHPEYGDLTVDWILAQMAGHDIHHLKQFDMVR